MQSLHHSEKYSSWNVDPFCWISDWKQRNYVWKYQWQTANITNFVKECTKLFPEVISTEQFSYKFAQWPSLYPKFN